MSIEAKRGWSWVFIVVAIATAATFGLGWLSDARASGAQAATIDLRVKNLEDGAKQTRDEIREIRQDQTAIRRTTDRMCGLMPGCRE
jgi:hypothetical protein